MSNQANLSDPWLDLVLEGNFALIERLKKAERKEPGFTTVVVHREGFSPNDATHNKVLNWLHKHNINVHNNELMIYKMFNALFCE